MNTYTGEPPNNIQGVENGKETDSVEDLFLPGGFDSFGGIPEPMNVGMGQMDGNMGQLGSVDYGNAYGTADHSATRWTNPIIVLSFWEQILNSFMPTRYGRYKGMSEGAAKEFVKSFTRLYIRIAYLMMAFMILAIPGGREYLKSGDASILLIVILLGVLYVMYVYFEPYYFRLRAFIYRLLFGNLLMTLTKTNITSNNMYLVSIYACVPCMVISVLLTVVVILACLGIPLLLYVVYAFASIAWIFTILLLVVPVIIMAIAIPRME